MCTSHLGAISAAIKQSGHTLRVHVSACKKKKKQKIKTTHLNTGVKMTSGTSTSGRQSRNTPVKKSREIQFLLYLLYICIYMSTRKGKHLYAQPRFIKEVEKRALKSPGGRTDGRAGGEGVRDFNRSFPGSFALLASSGRRPLFLRLFFPRLLGKVQSQVVLAVTLTDEFSGGVFRARFCITLHRSLAHRVCVPCASTET